MLHTDGSPVITCCQECHMKCRVKAVVNQGKIVDISGTLCEKGAAVLEKVYHEQRLLYPLRRKRDGWDKITWDEAFDVLGGKLLSAIENHGRQSVNVTCGCMHKENAATASYLLGHLLNLPNVLSANHVCSLPGSIADRCTFGARIHGDRYVNFTESSCILLWGSNPAATRPAQYMEIIRAKKAGAYLIVVDPRFSETAQQADLWLRVRPGTDGALALGMLNIAVNERLYNVDFVERYCYGFEELKGRIQAYPVQKVSAITGVPIKQIEQATKFFFSIKPACIQARLGVDGQHINATQSARAVFLLSALSGNIDRPGCNLMPNERRFLSVYDLPGILRCDSVLEDRRFGAKDFPLMCGSKETAPEYYHAHVPTGIEAMLNGDVKVLFLMGNNMIIQEADSRKVQEALKRVDFIVATDLFMTPTTEMADIILPAAHWLETDTPLGSSTGKSIEIYAAPKVVLPAGECKDDREIVFELCESMGVDCGWNSVSEFNDFRLKQVGITFTELVEQASISLPVQFEKFRQDGFPTPTGKIELYSTRFAECGHDPLPYYEEPPQSPVTTPDIFAKYPFIIAQYRTKTYEHSEGRQIKSLRALASEPTVQLNSDAAGRLGIKENDLIKIEAPGFTQGIQGRAVLCSNIHPNVISVQQGWWFPEEPAPFYGCFTSNVNAIISNGPPYDPISGQYQMRATLCRITKII